MKFPLLLLLSSLHFLFSAALDSVPPATLASAGQECLRDASALSRLSLSENSLAAKLRSHQSESELSGGPSSPSAADTHHLPPAPSSSAPLPLVLEVFSPRQDDVILFRELALELRMFSLVAGVGKEGENEGDEAAYSKVLMKKGESDGLVVCVAVFNGRDDEQTADGTLNLEVRLDATTPKAGENPNRARLHPFDVPCQCIELPDVPDVHLHLKIPQTIEEGDVTIHIDVRKITAAAASLEESELGRNYDYATPSSVTVGRTRRSFQLYDYGRSTSPHLTPDLIIAREAPTLAAASTSAAAAAAAAAAADPSASPSLSPEFTSPPTPDVKPSSFFTLLYGDDYLPGLLGLSASIRASNSRYPLHVLIPLSSTSPTGLSVSSSTLLAISRVGATVVPVPDNLSPSVSLEVGARVPYLGVGQWLKLHLFSLTSFSRIVYLDADAILTANVDELFLPNAIPRFASVGDYFSGSVFVVVPDLDVHTYLLSLLSAGSRTRGFNYGEQDFLNFALGRGQERRVVLSNQYYHCIAEDFGSIEEDKDLPLTATCKIVEFASCNGIHGPLRWKPWMSGDKLPWKICKRTPTIAFKMLVTLWREFASSNGWVIEEPEEPLFY